MNKGLFHAILNPNGSKKASDDKFWYDTTVSFTSVADCFNTSKLLTNSGNVASGKSGRPDGKYYDVIYENQFKRCDTVAFRGYTELIKQIEESKYFKGIQSNKAFYDNAGTLTSTTVNYNSSGNHLEVEILGAKANYPTILTNRLNEGKRIFATLNQTDDTGASNLPNGSKTSFKMINKMLQNYEVIKYASGVYTKLTLTTHYTVNLTTNTINFVTAPLSTDVFFIANKMQNNPLSLVNLVDYSVIWEDNFVFVSNNYDVSKKVPLLVNNITNKISVGTSPIEQLAITKIVSDLVYTTAKTATVDASIRFILAVKDDEYYAGVRADIGDTNSIDLTDNIYLMPLGVSR